MRGNPSLARERSAAGRRWCSLKVANQAAFGRAVLVEGSPEHLEERQVRPASGRSLLRRFVARHDFVFSIDEFAQALLA
jgi:hypothetical protein